MVISGKDAFKKWSEVLLDMTSLDTHDINQFLRIHISINYYEFTTVWNPRKIFY